MRFHVTPSLDTSMMRVVPRVPAATSCVLLILIAGLRYLRLYQRRTSQAGRQLVRLIPVLLITILMLRTVAAAAGVSTTPWSYNWLSWCCVSSGGEARAKVLAELRAKGGKHLVFVRFGKDFRTFDWVYNPPDIDAAGVVFARDMGVKANQELLDYYPRRKVWLVEPDNKPVRLRPYPRRPRSAP